MYLQRLEEARVFVRYAERAYNDAISFAPDQLSMSESVALRSDAAALRRMTTAHRQRAMGRFNPKRVRRVMIEEARKSKRKGQ